MTRVLAVGVLALVVVVGGCFVWSLLTPDEEKIRSLLEGMTDDFNEGRMRAFLAEVTNDYRDQSYGVDRAQLEVYLLRLTLTATDSRNAFLFRAVISEAMDIELSDDSRAATARFPVEFYDLSQSRPDPSMESNVAVFLEKRDGWKVVKTDFRRVRGNLRF